MNEKVHRREGSYEPQALRMCGSRKFLIVHIESPDQWFKRPSTSGPELSADKNAGDFLFDIDSGKRLRLSAFVGEWSPNCRYMLASFPKKDPLHSDAQFYVFDLNKL